MIVAFTGHRPDKLGGYREPNPIQKWVVEQLHRNLVNIEVEHGTISHAITGMAQGVDTWAAEVCVERGIAFTAAVPFRGQERAWTDTNARVRYHKLLDRAESVVYVSKKYFKGAFQARNEFMVNRAGVLLSVWDGSPGGTANCTRYAMQVGKPIVRIDPGKSGLVFP